MIIKRRSLSRAAFPLPPASRGTQSIYEDGVSRGVCFLLVVVSLVFTVLTRSSWLTMYGDLLLVNESILEAVVPAAQDVTGRSRRACARPGKHWGSRSGGTRSPRRRCERKRCFSQLPMHVRLVKAQGNNYRSLLSQTGVSRGPC